LSGSRAGVCAVSVAEFWTGVPPERVPDVAELLDAFAYWDIPREVAERAGDLRYRLARRGYTLHVADALLAGLALSLDAVLVTDNQKDFVHTGVPLIGLRG
jgi:predicted nucleic acid-binding protein